jgi:hypothetical protein
MPHFVRHDMAAQYSAMSVAVRQAKDLPYRRGRQESHR